MEMRLEHKGFKSHSKVSQCLRYPPQCRILDVPNRGKSIKQHAGEGAVKLLIYSNEEKEEVECKLDEPVLLLVVQQVENFSDVKQVLMSHVPSHHEPHVQKFIV